MRVSWYGIVGGGLAVLAIAAAGYEWATWPDVAALAGADPATTAFIERYREERRAAGEPDAVRWQWVPAERISVHVQRAVVSAEDMEFFFHGGFSAAELKFALREAVAERAAPRGASTITQQLAKNLWLSPSRNPLRKLREVMLTRQLEKHLTKSRILELYLNVVELGRGIYGVEAAARHYFGKSAAALTEREAAMLAASLPRPGSWHPGIESNSYLGYVEEIEARMDRADYLWKYVSGPAPTADSTHGAP